MNLYEILKNQSLLEFQYDEFDSYSNIDVSDDDFEQEFITYTTEWFYGRMIESSNFYAKNKKKILALAKKVPALRPPKNATVYRGVPIPKKGFPVGNVSKKIFKVFEEAFDSSAALDKYKQFLEHCYTVGKQSVVVSDLYDGMITLGRSNEYYVSIDVIRSEIEDFLYKNGSSKVFIPKIDLPPIEYKAQHSVQSWTIDKNIATMFARKHSGVVVKLELNSENISDFIFDPNKIYSYVGIGSSSDLAKEKELLRLSKKPIFIEVTNAVLSIDEMLASLK
jgi:hypothetical protein